MMNSRGRFENLQYCERRGFGSDPQQRVRQSWAWWTPGWGWWICDDLWACGKTRETCRTKGIQHSKRPQWDKRHYPIVHVWRMWCNCVLRVCGAEDEEGTSLWDRSDLLFLHQVRDDGPRPRWYLRILLLRCCIINVLLLLLTVKCEICVTVRNISNCIWFSVRQKLRIPCHLYHHPFCPWIKCTFVMNDIWTW